MSRLTILSKARQGFLFAIILSLLAMLVLPISIPTHSIQDERIIHLTLEEALPSAENPQLNLTYQILTNLNDTPVISDSVIAGDHVTLKASWDPALIDKSRLEVFAPAIPATLEDNQNLSITEIDTRYLGNNATCSITATGWLANGPGKFLPLPWPSPSSLSSSCFSIAGTSSTGLLDGVVRAFLSIVK